MAGTVSARGKKAKAPARASRRAEEPLPALTVRHMRRMKRQRVYTCEVSWQAGKKRSPSVPVVVRLIMPGAQVIPSEHEMDPSRPKPNAIFYVTPLARGWLRGGRLEVLQSDTKVQEIRLPSKVVSQRMTWLLLALTFLVPWFLLTYVRPTPKVAKPMPGSAAVQLVPVTPGQLTKEAIEDNAAPVLAPVQENVPDAAKILDDVPTYIKSGIDYVHFQSLELPIAYWSGVALLVLTLLSAFAHRDVSRRRVGQPLRAPSSEEMDEE